MGDHLTHPVSLPDTAGSMGSADAGGRLNDLTEEQWFDMAVV